MSIKGPRRQTGPCTKLLFIYAVVSFAAGVSGAGMGPCHKEKWTLGANVTCEKVVLPVDLCSQCRLKPFNIATGEFTNCASIYNLDDVECRNELRKYAALNSACDSVRQRQVQDFSNLQNKQGLDYFVYSVCEECCDCVPHGSLREHYKWRARNHQLVATHRGNCPAHAFFDICKVLPNVRYVKRHNGVSEEGMDHWDWPKICPLLFDWFTSEKSRDWLYRGWVDMDWRIERFLNGFFWTAKCAVKRTWQSCTDLEDAQNRL